MGRFKRSKSKPKKEEFVWHIFANRSEIKDTKHQQIIHAGIGQTPLGQKIWE